MIGRADLHHMCMVKAKFRYAIQVADLAFDKFVRVCDQLATFFGSKAGGIDRFEPVCDLLLIPPKKNRELVADPHEIVGNRVCEQVCDLDSVMKFGTYTVSQKTVQNCFCQNFFKFPPILIIFGRKMAKRLQLCEVHSFFTSPNLCHHTTVLSADVPNCYTTLAVVSIRLLTIASSIQ